MCLADYGNQLVYYAHFEAVRLLVHLFDNFVNIGCQIQSIFVLKKISLFELMFVIKIVHKLETKSKI